MEPDCQLFKSIIENFTKKRFGLDSKPIYDYFELTINRVSKIPTASFPLFVRSFPSRHDQELQYALHAGKPSYRPSTTGRRREEKEEPSETSADLLRVLRATVSPIAGRTLSHILSRPFFSICAIRLRRICMNQRFQPCSVKTFGVSTWEGRSRGSLLRPASD